MRYLLLICLLFFMLFITTAFIQVQSASAHTQQTTCTNIPATPDYLSSGRASDAITAINHARQREHIHPLQLPGNFYQLSPIQQQFKLVNAERVDRGLRPLLLNTILAQIAQSYAQQMETQHFFSHTSPAGVTFVQRINNNPFVYNHYSGAAENIAANPIAGVGPIYEYMYDDAGSGCGHRANILMPQLTHIGIGVANDSAYGTLSVQDFIASACWNPYKG
jgi:uncharacterized protein YkwD